MKSLIQTASSSLTGVALAGLMLLPVLPASSTACCMVPVTYQGTISQSAQEAVIFHEGDREELILRINYKLSGKTAPDKFAWIITVPNEPDKYSVADGALFEKTFNWAKRTMFIPNRTKGKAFGGIQSNALPAPKADLEFGKRVEVGPYDIQPVRALGLEALNSLNAWLKKNGFPTEDVKHMAYFVEKKFTFLAIKVNPVKGKKSVNMNGQVEPLHLSFKSEEVYYPLRFSSRQGVFDLNVYVFTDSDFDFNKSSGQLKKVNWHPASNLKKNVKVKTSSLPKLLLDQLKKGNSKLAQQKSWTANLIRTKATNKGNAIASWKEDVFFSKKAG